MTLRQSTYPRSASRCKCCRDLGPARTCISRLIRDARTLRVRHYERGVGLTQACGTGAVACAAAAIVARGVASPVTVEVPGGVLGVVWRAGETARLTGGAEMLFERTLSL